LLELNATLLAQIFHFILLILVFGFAVCLITKSLGRSREWRRGKHSPDLAQSVPGSSSCLRCSRGLELVGVEKFRCGGTSGGWKLIFGEWAELGEQMIPLEVWACPQCRTVELRVPAEK
jgi:hypothetical protein